MITRFVSEHYTFVYDQTTKILRAPDLKTDYDPESFWQLMQKARKECIEKHVSYKITQVKKEIPQNDDRNSAA